MYNYKIVFKFVEFDYDKETMEKVMNNLLALNGSLYALDYDGYENGSNISIENDEYKLTVIVNNDDYVGYSEVIEDVRKNIENHNYKITKYDIFVNHTNEVIEIPEGYIEQYYSRWYRI